MRDRLQRLAEMVQAVEERSGAGAAGNEHGREAIATGWAAVDETLVYSRHARCDRVDSAEIRREEQVRGLVRGAVHEWFGLAETSAEMGKRKKAETQKHRSTGTSKRRGRRTWTPPVCLLSHLAWRALAQSVTDTEGRKTPGGYVVWIGRRLWPYPRVLLRGNIAISRFADPCLAPSPFRGESRSEGVSTECSAFDDRDRVAGGLLLKRSLFIDPPDDASRLWAIDLALRCPAIIVVVADGSGLRMAETRRLQLAAEASRGLALLARPPDELAELSAATTRWRVGPAPSPTGRPRWFVELLRCKGALTCHQEIAAAGSSPSDTEVESRSAAELLPDTKSLQEVWVGGKHRWILEWDHAQGAIAPSADVVDRPGETTTSVEQLTISQDAGNARRRRKFNPRSFQRRWTA